MHLGIDASNLSSGGGITHLSRILHAANPIAAGIDKVTVWASQPTISQLPKRDWLHFQNSGWITAGLFLRLASQQLVLPKELERFGCDILFSPGGTLPRISGIPEVTMSQNMLPFEAREAARFGVLSTMWLKLKLLRISQGRSFRQADGLIFLTHYAQKVIQTELRSISTVSRIISHGIEARFFAAPRPQRSIEKCNAKKPFRFLYVSILMPYKHQISVARAVKNLHSRGFPIEIRFVGVSWATYGRRFQAELAKLDPEGEFLKWEGFATFEAVHRHYQEAEAFVFGSSCENLPNILLEAMASGLPIACSDRGPMTEVLGEAGVYFDPEKTESISDALELLVSDAELRSNLAERAYSQASNYSWEQCAQQTFEFIADTAKK